MEQAEEMVIPSSDGEPPSKRRKASAEDSLNALTLRLTRAYEVIHSQQSALESLGSQLEQLKQEKGLSSVDSEPACISQSQMELLSENQRLRKENDDLLAKLSSLQSGSASAVSSNAKPSIAPDSQAWQEEVSRVTSFMEQTGIKQHALARRVGCSQGTLSTWLKLKYAGDVSRVTSRIHSALDILETMSSADLNSSTDCVLSVPCTLQRKNFTREQISMMEAIAKDTATPQIEVIEELSAMFNREQRHIVKWFSNWRSRKGPKQTTSRANPAFPMQLQFVSYGSMTSPVPYPQFSVPIPGVQTWNVTQM